MAMGGLVPEMPLDPEPAQAKRGERLPDNATPPMAEMPKMDDDEAPSQMEEEDELMQELMKQHGV